MRDTDLTVVHSFASQPEADLAKSALEAAGIEAIIQADSVGGMRPHIAWSSNGFKVIVRQEDADDARAVLEASENAHNSRTSSPGRVVRMVIAANDGQSYADYCYRPDGWDTSIFIGDGCDIKRSRFSRAKISGRGDRDSCRVKARSAKG